MGSSPSTSREASTTSVLRPVPLALVVILLTLGCLNPEKGNETERQPPAGKPEGLLIERIPPGADVIFSSVRHVLEELDCLDDRYDLKADFILDEKCNSRIYAEGGGLRPRRQLFLMDIDTGEVKQITNLSCHFSSGQATSATSIVAAGSCSDTNGDGRVGDGDKMEICLLDLASGSITSLTSDAGLSAINNPDYSRARGEVVFSARNGTYGEANHLYTVDLEGNLKQLTAGDGFSDFDCSWSEDGDKVVFSRLPFPIFTQPSGVWVLNTLDGSMEQYTAGGQNPNREDPLGPYPIGIDADPDLSPDGSSVVFSRLRTGKENKPFGIFELIVMDLESREEIVLDSTHANMLPEWKEDGILLVRQSAAQDPMEVSQRLCLYSGGAFKDLEKHPYDVFPVGAFSGSWVVLE